VDLTPTNPTTLQFTVPAEAPVLLGAALASSSANSIVLNFTGYSTTRTLTTLNLQFTAAAGFTLATTQLSIPISGASAIWFGSATSQGSGGQFTVSMPLTFSGTTPTGVALLQTIASVSGTVSNESGTSNAVTTPIQ
jgi:multidrug transporter EmrE-like cation transporter